MEDVNSFARRLVQDVAEAVGGQVAVVVWPDGCSHPFAAVWGNASGHASMARRLCELAADAPRSTECECCAKAWDRLQLAALALHPADQERPCA